MEFYNKKIDDIQSELNVDLEKGLTTEQVKVNAEKYGKNIVIKQESEHWSKILLETIADPIIIIMAIAVMISFAMAYLNPHDEPHKYLETGVILSLVILNVVMGFTQTIKAQNKIKELDSVVEYFHDVLRDGSWQKVNVTELVVGDIIKAKAGDILKVDARVIDENFLEVNEAFLTGEAENVSKNSNAIHETGLNPHQIKNTVYSGSFIANGNCTAVVTSVGMETEIGKIFDTIQSAEKEKTPLEITLEKLSKILVIVAFIGAAIIAVGCFAKGLGLGASLQMTISVLISVVPEGLPTVLTIVLTLGSAKMVKKNALARNLQAVETLGATSYVCSDKTGTITKNEMTVKKIYVNGEFFEVTGEGYMPSGDVLDASGNDATTNVSNLVETAAKVCDTTINVNDEGKYEVIGNITEAAILTVAEKIKLAAANKEDLEVMFPFNSTFKTMGAIYQENGKFMFYVKGAPDYVTSYSTNILVNNSVEKLENHVDNFNAAIDAFADEALRTIAVAYKEVDASTVENDFETLLNDLTLLGVFGIIDPPKTEVMHSVKLLQSASVKVTMITGDYEKTAAAIARQIGLITPDRSIVMNGKQLDEMPEAEFLNVVEHVAVFARVTPDHKLRIIKALQANGEVVAMTGDGVNDSPALKKANVGVAMGIQGSEVSKDVADLILLDDSFSTIEVSIEAGREMFDNIRKFTRQMLTSNMGHFSTVLFTLMFGVYTTELGVLALTPLMILWINIISDAIPSMAIGFDVPESDLMQQAPRDINSGIFYGGLGSKIIIRGLFLGFLTFFMFQFSMNTMMNNPDVTTEYAVAFSQTIAFLTLSFAQLWHIFDARSNHSIFRRNPFNNKTIVGAVALSAALNILMVVTPFGNLLLGTVAIPLNIFVAVVLISSIPTFVLSGIKELFKLEWL